MARSKNIFARKTICGKIVCPVIPAFILTADSVEHSLPLSGVLLNSGRRVSDPLPPSAALSLTEGENRVLQAFNLPLVRGRRERSERGGRSHIILNCSLEFAPLRG